MSDEKRTEFELNAKWEISRTETMDAAAKQAIALRDNLGCDLSFAIDNMAYHVLSDLMCMYKVSVEEYQGVRLSKDDVLEIFGRITQQIENNLQAKLDGESSLQVKAFMARLKSESK
jgi:hypothetical protein